jgi:hypothetical protein
MNGADIRFYFDPVCPFAWMTSNWVRMVAAQRDYTVDWRFISLRLINSAVDYDSHFPAGYEEGHSSGLRLLRVAARVRAEQGRAAVGAFYEAVSMPRARSRLIWTRSRRIAATIRGGRIRMICTPASFVGKVADVCSCGERSLQHSLCTLLVT